MILMVKFPLKHNLHPYNNCEVLRDDEDLRYGHDPWNFSFLPWILREYSVTSSFCSYRVPHTCVYLTSGSAPKKGISNMYS